MTTQTKGSTLQRRDDPPIVALLKQYEVDLTQALPQGYTPGRFQSTCINILRTTPELLKAEPMSFVGSVLMAAQLGLEPGTQLGLSWIIPRRNKGRLEASFQMGYQGLRQLAYRSGVVSFIEARIVHEGDKYHFAHGRGGTNWEHQPSGEAGKDWTDVYCTAQLVTGAEAFESMTKAEVLEHRDRYVPEWKKSKAWKENEPEMARKTVTAKLCRQLPMSVEYRTALVADGASPREIAPDLAGFAALEPPEPEAEVVEAEAVEEKKETKK